MYRRGPGGGRSTPREHKAAAYRDDARAQLFQQRFHIALRGQLHAEIFPRQGLARQQGPALRQPAPLVGLGGGAPFPPLLAPFRLRRGMADGCSSALPAGRGDRGGAVPHRGTGGRRVRTGRTGGGRQATMLHPGTLAQSGARAKYTDESLFSLKRFVFPPIRPGVSRKTRGFPLGFGRAALCRRLAFHLFKEKTFSRRPGGQGQTAGQAARMSPDGLSSARRWGRFLRHVTYGGSGR